MLAWGLMGCGAGPQVSAWGPGGTPPLTLVAEKPDLAKWQRAIEGETAAAGVTQTNAASITAPDGGRYWVARYRGEDRLGRATHAVRVASPRGVVLALGPADELAPSSALGEAPLTLPDGRNLPADLDGDGALELPVQARDGSLTLFRLAPDGAYEVPIRARTPARALVVTAGGVALCSPHVPPAGPRLCDLALPEGGAFSAFGPNARRAHRALAELLAAAPRGETPEQRDERLLERAFHRLRAGEPVGAVRIELAVSQAATSERKERAAAAVGWLDALAEDQLPPEPPMPP